MKTSASLLLLIALATSLCAQTLAPELAPLATKYKADLAALDAQRVNAIGQAQAAYVAAMATAEKNATKAGNVAALSAITAERGAVTGDLMSPGMPPGLPKELQNPRKAYLDAVARIRAAETPRRQALDGAYLRALTGLGAKAPKESELAKQVEGEKQKLIASAPSTNPSKASSKNVVVNGTFDIVGAAGQPGGWTMAEGYKVQRDGNNYVMHATCKVPAYLSVNQDILIPARARSVTLTGRVRGKILARDPAKSQGPPGVFLAAQYLDKNDAPTTNWMMLDGGNDMAWKIVTMTQKIPEDMKVLQVALVLKYVSGEFDFDDIEVEFR
jgi:hypothetical protein